mmetsp:Transcript_40613/g.85268  ORF Transcript_40613/g.85268 Transcript_40613/m.85268 type:complete len:403 (+) Transcript_40613:316-1524(+)
MNVNLNASHPKRAVTNGKSRGHLIFLLFGRKSKVLVLCLLIISTTMLLLAQMKRTPHTSSGDAPSVESSRFQYNHQQGSMLGNDSTISGLFGAEANSTQYNKSTDLNSSTKQSSSLTLAQRSEIFVSVCMQHENRYWMTLCSENFVDAVAQPLAGGKDVNVIQIGAHVGFEKNDLIANALSSLLDSIVNVTQNNNLRRHFHWTFVEPSPTNYQQLQVNLQKHSDICDMNSVNAAILPDDLVDNPGEMVFYSIRDTVHPETGFDSLSGKQLPFWVTQISSLDRATLTKHMGPFKRLGLDMEDYIVETNVSSTSYSDLMQQVLVHTDKEEAPLLVLVDTEGLDCSIIQGISPSSRFLPKYLIYEHLHCQRDALRGAVQHLINMNYLVHPLKENTIAIKNELDKT